MKKHALNMILYAIDAAMYDSPWSMWEVKLTNGDWKSLFVAPMWQSGAEYRRKSNAPVCDGEQFALLETVYSTLTKRLGAARPFFEGIQPSAGYGPPPVTPRDRHNDPMYAHERIDAETKNRRSSTQFLASEIDKERVGRINSDKALSDRLEVVETALASLQTQVSNENLLRDDFQKDTRNRMDGHAETLSSIVAQLATMPNVLTIERIVAEKLAANITSPQNDTELNAKRWRKYQKGCVGWTPDALNAYVDALPDHD